MSKKLSKQDKNKIILYGLGGLLLFVLTLSMLKAISGQSTHSFFREDPLSQFKH